MSKFYFTANLTKSGKSDKGFFVEGYAATTDLDRQGDIIAIDALKDAAPGMIENGHTVFFNHDYNRCIGRLDDASVDEKGMKVRIYVSEWEQELRQKIAEGIINKFSIGGKVLAAEKVTPSEAMHRYPGLKVRPSAPVTLIEKMELFEVSIVGLPANAKAEFVQKSLYQALHDATPENLGQIPDRTGDGVVPKPIAKDLIEPVAVSATELKNPDLEVKMEEVVKKEEAPIVQAQETAVPEVVKAEEQAPVAKSEPGPEEECPKKPEDEKVEKAEAPAEVAPEFKAEVVTETHAVEAVTTTVSEGKFEQKVETAAVEVTEKVINDAVKVTETVVTQQVRTYTEEELTKMKQEYEKQLSEKDAAITSLKGELAKAQDELSKVAPIAEKLDTLVKSVGELATKAVEVKIDSGKTSKLVVKDEPVVKTATVVKSADEQFADILNKKL